MESGKSVVVNRFLGDTQPEMSQDSRALFDQLFPNASEYSPAQKGTNSQVAWSVSSGNESDEWGLLLKT